MALSAGVDDRAPAQNPEDRVFRRFIKDPTRTSDVTTKFWDFMGQTTGKYSQAVNTYDSLVKGFRDQDAKDFLAKLPGAERALRGYALGRQRGRQARLHGRREAPASAAARL
jgi:hypothetical protein